MNEDWWKTVPHRCPRCTDRHYYGLLKVPKMKLKSCPNCRSRLVPVKDWSPPPHDLIDPAEEEQDDRLG